MIREEIQGVAEVKVRGTQQKKVKKIGFKMSVILRLIFNSMNLVNLGCELMEKAANMQFLIFKIKDPTKNMIVAQSPLT